MPNKDQFKINPPKTYEVFRLEEQQIEPTKLVFEPGLTAIENPASNRIKILILSYPTPS